MKKHAATLLILILVALTGLVNAQTRTVIKAQVPFDFIVNGKMLPAGECTIKVEGNSQTLLWIVSGDRHLFAIPNSSESVKASEETTLVFHRYGDRYFLASISRQGESRGYELPAGKVEKELRAQNTRENVTLAASIR